MTTLASVLLAPDPAVPLRDALLDPQRAPVPVDASAVEVVRCKYRVGESIRVLYRCATADGPRLVTVRASAGREPRWWTLPDDRRLPHVAALLEPAPEMVALAGGRAWTRSEIAEYAPERSITVRAVASDGSATAFAKHYAQGERDVSVLAARYTHVARARARTVGSSAARMVVRSRRAGARRCAGKAVGRHRRGGGVIRVVVDGPRDRSPPRCACSSRDTTVRAARRRPCPAVGAGARRSTARRRVHVRDLAWRLAASRVAGPPVLLHGDCHPKNAIVDGELLTLIDLDQAGCGAAAADIGSLLARVRTADIIAAADAAPGASVADAFLAGYASQRSLPPDESLRWHTAAALIVEQAVRAVNRVRRRGARRAPCRTRGRGRTPATSTQMRPRLLFHCQHSLGLGHLVRSLSLAGGLAEHADVTLLNGGRLPAGTIVPPGVELVDLPSLGHDDTHTLVSHEAGRSVDEVKDERRRRYSTRSTTFVPTWSWSSCTRSADASSSSNCCPSSTPRSTLDRDRSSCRACVTSSSDGVIRLATTSASSRSPTVTSTPSSSTATLSSQRSRNRSGRSLASLSPCTTPGSSSPHGQPERVVSSRSDACSSPPAAAWSAGRCSRSPPTQRPACSPAPASRRRSSPGRSFPTPIAAS